MAHFLLISLTLVVLLVAVGINISTGNSYNSNLDNDEEPPTPRPSDPPFESQFLETSNGLVIKEAPNKIEPEAENEIKPSVASVDTDDTENSEEEDELPTRARRRGRRALFQTRQGTACGYQRLRPGQMVTVQSTNFNTTGGGYSNLELCTWRFFGQQCTVKAYCPCFQLPTSSDCKGDFLKLTDTYSFAHKFCGDHMPLGYYNSTTNNLKVQFRSDAQNVYASGFICYVTCTGPGRADPIIPMAICPPNSTTTLR